jgi:ABC-type branched-subunit amino acid transport system substrate-binding protein
MASLIACVALAALVAVGCGSDDSGDDGGGADAATTKVPTKAPIKIMVQAPDASETLRYPEALHWGDVYADWINENGGIDGHPLEVVECDNKNDPNVSAECARKAVSEKVTAVVGPVAFLADREIPILEKNDIAWFGGPAPATPSENTSDISYPVGSVLLPAGLGALAGKECKKPALVTPDTPAADLVGGLVEKGLAGSGVKLVKLVKVPPTAGDYSPQVAQVTGDDVDCILVGLPEAGWMQWMAAMKQAGGTQRLLGVQGNFTQRVFEAFPQETEDALVINNYPPITDPSLAQARKLWADSDPPKDYIEDGLVAEGAYVALRLFTDIAGKIDGPVDNETFLAALRKTTAASSDDIMLPIDFTKPIEAIPGFDRIFYPYVNVATVKDGKPTQFGSEKWIDMRPVLKGQGLDG